MKKTRGLRGVSARTGERHGPALKTLVLLRTMMPKRMGPQTSALVLAAMTMGTGILVSLSLMGGSLQEARSGRARQDDSVLPSSHYEKIAQSMSVEERKEWAQVLPDQKKVLEWLLVPDDLVQKKTELLVSSEALIEAMTQKNCDRSQFDVRLTSKVEQAIGPRGGASPADPVQAAPAVRWTPSLLMSFCKVELFKRNRTIKD